MDSQSGGTTDSGTSPSDSRPSELVEAFQEALRSAEELGREFLLQARTNVDLPRERVENKVESTAASLWFVLFSAGLAVGVALLAARGLSAFLSAVLPAPGLGDLAAAAVLSGSLVAGLALRRKRRRATRLDGLRAKYDPVPGADYGGPA